MNSSGKLFLKAKTFFVNKKDNHSFFHKENNEMRSRHAIQPLSLCYQVRRTRISERIKKLQDLFPKSDKVHTHAHLYI